jgi:hypothetical protein
VPTKTWLTNEEVLADDFNTYLANQVVATFASDAARTAAMPLVAGDKGRVSALDDHAGALWLWDGTNWREPSSPRNAPGVNLHMQAGQDVSTTNGAGGSVITFPVPFLTPPLVVLLQDMGGTPSAFAQFTVLLPPTTVDAQFVARNQSGVLIASGAVRVGWLAIGERAPG